MNSNPSPAFEIPLIIYIPDIRPNIQIYQPSNWNPLIMNNIEVSFSSSDNGKTSKDYRQSDDYQQTSDFFCNSNGTFDEVNQKQNSSNGLIKMKSSDNNLMGSYGKKSNGSNIKIITEYKDSDETEIIMKIKPFLDNDKEGSS